MLQTLEGRRRLIEGLKAIDSPLARALRFICYTGIRRRAAAGLSRQHMVANGVLEFHSKTRSIRLPLSRQAHALLDLASESRLLHIGDKRLSIPLIRLFGHQETPRGRRARVTPHDLRRYFKSVGTELGIDPTIMNLLVGHTVKGVDKHYLAKLRLGVLRSAAQRIADEIERPQDPAGDDDITLLAANLTTSAVQPEPFESYLGSLKLPSLTALAQPPRYAHYLRRADLQRLVWTAPLSELAARFGLSDVGLAKACRRARIPLPGRGHWARIEAGHAVPNAVLASDPQHLLEVVRITGKRSPPSASIYPND